MERRIWAYSTPGMGDKRHVLEGEERGHLKQSRWREERHKMRWKRSDMPGSESQAMDLVLISF